MHAHSSHLATVSMTPPAHGMSTEDTMQDQLTDSVNALHQHWQDARTSALLANDPLYQQIKQEEIAEYHHIYGEDAYQHSAQQSPLTDEVHHSIKTLLNGQEMMYAPPELISEITHEMLQKAREIQMESGHDHHQATAQQHEKQNQQEAQKPANKQQLGERRAAKTTELKEHIGVGKEIYNKALHKIRNSNRHFKKAEEPEKPEPHTSHAGHVEAINAHSYLANGTN